MEKSFYISGPNLIVLECEYARGRVASVLDYEAGNPGSNLVAAELSTGYSVLGDNLTRYCYQQYGPRMDNRGGN